MLRVDRLPPTADNRSRWWRRSASRSVRTSVRLRTSRACWRRCAASSPVSAFPAASGDASRASSYLHQSGFLKRRFHQCIALADPVFRLQLVVKCCSPAPTAAPARALSRECASDSDPLAVVAQSAVAVFFGSLTPAPRRPVRYPDGLGRLPPLQAPGHRFQNHFLHFHHPLHFCG